MTSLLICPLARVTEQGARLSSPLVDLKAVGLKKRLTFSDDVHVPTKQESSIAINQAEVVAQTDTDTSDESLADQINRQLDNVRQERVLLEERIKSLNDRESDLLQQLERAQMLRDLM